MNIFKILSLLFALFLVSCAQHSDNTVIIHSMPADSIFTEINISAMSFGQKDIIFEGGKTCRFEVDTVVVRSFYSNCSERGGNSFGTRIFITPGDSVSFKTAFKEVRNNYYCKNYYEVVFEGKNAAHYNYFSKKNNAVPWEEAPNYNPGMDLLEYKQMLQDFRDREHKFLRDYKKKYAVSEDFINYASAEINDLYAYKLYEILYLNKCLQTLPEGYLDDAVISQNPLSFYSALGLELKYIYCSSDKNIEQMYNAILNDVHSKFHSTLLSTLITYFAEKGDKSYKKSLLQVMNRIEKTSTDSTLLATVQEYKPYYLLSGTMLPDNILNNTYLRTFQSNQKITLRQLLDNYKNTAVYLDFWASWCSPCRYTIRASAENKSYFSEKQIAVVYISIDENESAWLQAAKDDRITENQYLLLDANKSLIKNYLKINGIPRFILFNKNHEIEMLNAPRPVDCSFEELKKFIEYYPEKFIGEKLVANTNIAKKEVQRKPIFKDCEGSSDFEIKTIYHDNFGTFSSATSYVDAWGVPKTPAKNWQTTYSPFTIPSHKTMFGWCDDGYYIISALKSPALPNYMKGGMTKDASGDPNGAALAINVAKNYKGEIYRQQIDNLPADAILYFEVSIANGSYVDNTTPPQVEIRIEKTNGKLLGNAHSNLTSATFGWQKVNIDVPPIHESSVVLRVISAGENWKSGCDLLMDDIIFRICSRR